jgi:Uma2 family endonuclease
MATASTKPATLEDFLRAEAEAPEGTRLALIDGEIVEWGANMTTRNARHSATMALMAYALLNWLDSQPDRQGVVAAGEARCRLRKDSETVVGLDVAYFEGDLHQESSATGDAFEGPPVIAVEIPSGSDTHDDHDDIVERLRVLLEAGVKQVWIADPDLRNVVVHRPNDEAALFTIHQELTAEPELPGFRVSVAKLFPKPSK